MIYVLIIDTSAHMNQKTAVGSTLLQMAKKIAYQIMNSLQAGDKIVLFTNESSQYVKLYNSREEFGSIIDKLQANSIFNPERVIENAVNCMHEFILFNECDTFEYGRHRGFSIPLSYIYISSSRSLDVNIKFSTYLAKEQLVSPFRWDQRFNAIIIHSPLFSGGSCPNYAESSLSSICTSTHGQLHIADSSNYLQSVRSAFFQGNIAITFNPLILLHVDQQSLPTELNDVGKNHPEWIQYITQGNEVTFTFPLVGHRIPISFPISDKQKNTRKTLFLNECQEWKSSYIYPEQCKEGGNCRSVYPQFFLRHFRETISHTKLIVCQGRMDIYNDDNDFFTLSIKSLIH